MISYLVLGPLLGRISFEQFRRSLLVMLWFALLTFPLMVMRLDVSERIIRYSPLVIPFIALGALELSVLWSTAIERSRRGGMPGSKEAAQPAAELETGAPDQNAADSLSAASDVAATGEQSTQSASGRLAGAWESMRQALGRPEIRTWAPRALLLTAAVYPLVTNAYQTGIMISALTFIVLGLGLNIVIGLGGMLHLGYAAFYAVGAYTYGLLNLYFGVGFWLALPLGAITATVFGLVVSLPVLRLRGDYLAIVTLGFGEIVRLVLNNWVSLTRGAAGIPGIPRPGLFGMDMRLGTATVYTYYIVLAMTVLVIFITRRLKYSRLGRTWVAMKEDEIAARAMGVDIARAKMAAFAISAAIAGAAGVIFAARTTFINPGSFNVLQSVLILCVVVLGGLGSIPGVVLGGLIMILVPEYFRAFSEYRQLLVGAVLVIMMVFRPQGLIPEKRQAYTFIEAESRADTHG